MITKSWRRVGESEWIIGEPPVGSISPWMYETRKVVDADTRLHPLVEEAITSYGVANGPSLDEFKWRIALKHLSDTLFTLENKLDAPVQFYAGKS